MAVPRLHRKLAKVEPTQEGILAFANQYGILGRFTWLCSIPDTDVHCDAESLDSWREAISRLRTLLHLFDALDLPVFEAIRSINEVIDVPNRFRGFIREEWRERNPGFVEALPYVYTPFAVKSDSPLDLARGYVLEHINHELADSVSPAIQLRKGSPIQFAPRDLIGAVYTHFASEAIGGGRPPALCKNCKVPWQKSRGNERYCCIECRNEFNNEKRKRKQMRVGAKIDGE